MEYGNGPQFVILQTFVVFRWDKVEATLELTNNAQTSPWWSWMIWDNSTGRPLERYNIKTLPGSIPYIDI